MQSKQERLLTYLNPLHQESEETKNLFDKWYQPSKSIQIRYVTFLTGILYLIYSQVDKNIAPTSALPLMTFFHLYILPFGLFFIAALTFKQSLNKLTSIYCG